MSRAGVGWDIIVMRICIVEAAIKQHPKPSISGKLFIETNEVLCTHLIDNDLYDQFWLCPQATIYTANQDYPNCTSKASFLILHASHSSILAESAAFFCSYLG